MQRNKGDMSHTLGKEEEQKILPVTVTVSPIHQGKQYFKVAITSMFTELKVTMVKM